MKRVAALLLVCIFLFPGALPLAAAGEEEYLVSIDFGETCIAKNAEVRMGDRGGVQTFSQDGVSCWKTDMASMAMYIYINIDDDLLYDELAALEVEITYYDDVNAHFALNYEGQSDTYQSTPGVQTQGTKEWKTVKFYIDDVKLANGENGNDMRLTPFVDGEGKSQTDLCFKSLRIKRVKFKNPVRMTYTMENPGGIFHGETGRGNLHFENILDEPFDVSGEITLCWDEEPLYTEPIQFQIAANGEYDLAKEFRLERYGLYTAKVHLKDSGGYFDWTYDVSMSRTKYNETQNMSYGTNGHYGQGKGSHEINARLMREAGCGWVRDGINWLDVEKEPGVFNFPERIVDGVDAYVENGLEVLLMIGYWNPLYDEGKTPASDEAIAAYARYAAETAKQFQGKVHTFEIWNEYNINGFNPSNEPPETYAKMLKAAYEAIKAVNPQATVVGCATSEIDIGWIERVFAAGGYAYMDVVSIHPYTRREPDRDALREDIQTLKELCKKYGNGQEKPIWITEDGYSSSTNHQEIYGYTEDWIAASQAKHPLADVVYDICDKVFMYDFQNDGPDINSSEHNFGLIKTWGYGISDPYSAKKGYASVAFANFFAANYTYDKPVADTAEERIFLYQKNDGTEQGIAMWSAGRIKRVTLQLGPEITVYDMYGNPEVRQSGDGLYTFELTGSPVYITGAFAQPKTAENPYEAKESHISAARGETFDIVLQRLRTETGKTFLVQDGQGLTDIQTLEFAAGEAQKALQIQIPNTMELGSYEMQLADEAGEILPITVTLDITEPVTVSNMRTGLMYKDKWDYWYGEVDLTNNSHGPISGSIYFTDYAYAPRVPAPFYNLAPGETRTVRMVFAPMREKRIAQTELVVALSNGVQIAQTVQLSFLAAKKAGADKPVIDGVLTPGEWRSGTAIFIDQADMVRTYTDYGGPADMSGKAYLMWDEEYLYVGAQVTDNIFSQTETDKYIWRGDMMQVGIFDRALEEDYRGQNFEIGLAQTQKGTEVYRYLGIGYKIGPVEAIEASVKNTGNVTVYEAKIPWKEVFEGLVEIEDGKTITFSMLINDNDGTGRRGWLEYGSGIGAAKDPSLYLDLYLAGE